MVSLSADTGLRASVGVFLLSSIFLSTTYETTFFFDRPVNSLVFTCFLSGIALIIVGKITPCLPTSPYSSPKQRYAAIPLSERGESPARETWTAPGSPNGEISVPGPRSWRYWLRIAVVVAIACIRVEIYREVTLKVECAAGGYHYTIPFLISLYDYWRNQRRRPAPQTPSPRLDQPPSGKLGRAFTAVQGVYLTLCQARIRYVISAALLMAGGSIASSFNNGRQSTFICPITSGLGPYMKTARLFSVLLDSFILVAAAELCRDNGRSRDGRRKSSPLPWGFCLLGVAFVWLITGVTLARRNHIDILVPDDRYFRSAFGQASLVMLLLVSAFQLISYYDVVGLSILAGFIVGYFSWISALFNGQEPYPYLPSSHAFMSIFATSLGTVLFFCSRSASGDEQKPLYMMNLIIRVSVLIMTGIGMVFVFNQPSLGGLHPVDLLIYDSRNRHETWLTQARSTESLAGAAREYRKRYHQHPPPGFDVWYEYATKRKSVVIDDFDQIYEDLLPFRAVSPERLRELTFEIATNPNNDVGALVIRNGTVKVQEQMKPTHRWMVEGAAKVMEPFVQHLPDMDLIFNLNDEPRVAMPWGRASEMRNHARSQETVIPEEEVETNWSEDRAAGWAPVDPADQTSFTMFTDTSWTNVFDRFVSVVCPPSSKARSQRIWDRHDVCLSCIRPHTMGQFPVDWNTAADICHQPDLKWLHGFMLSPASLKVTQELAPVFSQSKISGFNDILFPSPWNYVDKVMYEPSDEYPDPPYTEKENGVFWIGSTSEGVSNRGEWKGMPRQRLAHLINNNTMGQVSVLLPGSQPGTYTYQIMDGDAPARDLGLQADVHISDVIRCGDCDEQIGEFKPSPHVEFQSHWKHRYLIDLDGAGFSGRFLPFLQSRSIPFKTGLFRQWFDRRITSWLHYVPVDPRLQDVWSTLAYFAGVNVPVTNRETGESKPWMAPHDVQGKWIANEGRKWAQAALRKEDMEIYFFRLLLEWARLTDDRRDSLGYLVV